METPELSVNTTSTIIPRRALPNPRIPAFLDGRLVWGQLPSPPANASMPAAMAGGLGGRSGTAMAMGGNGSGNGSMAGLPAGITCESGKDGKGQNCGWVQAVWEGGWHACDILALPASLAARGATACWCCATAQLK